MKSTTANFTVDSNILIYAFGSQNEEKKKLAKLILSDCKAMSIQTVNESVFILQKKFNYTMIELGDVIQFFKENFQIRDLGFNILEKGMDIMRNYKYGFWDSMMLASALINNCEVIYSEDMQHNQIIEDKLKIVNPFVK
jgi:predicted nucleic acid-binding protein